MGHRQGSWPHRRPDRHRARQPQPQRRIETTAAEQSVLGTQRRTETRTRLGAVTTRKPLGHTRDPSLPASSRPSRPPSRSTRTWGAKPRSTCSSAWSDSPVSARADPKERHAMRCSPVMSTSPGQGQAEGLNHLFAHYDKQSNTTKFDRHAAYFTVPEIDTLAGLGSRNGSTLLPQLCKAWSGESLYLRLRGRHQAPRHTRPLVPPVHGRRYPAGTRRCTVRRRRLRRAAAVRVAAHRRHRRTRHRVLATSWSNSREGNDAM